MNQRLTLRRTAALVAACCAGLAFYFLCRDVGRTTALSSIAREGRREDVLERKAESFRRFDEAKRRVAAEVAAGRMSLGEAVDNFRHLKHVLERSPDAPSGAALLPEDDEALGRSVLARVGAALRTDPGRATAVLGRLGGEFRARFGHGPGPAIRFTGGTMSFTMTGEVELKLEGVELRGVTLKLQ